MRLSFFVAVQAIAASSLDGKKKLRPLIPILREQTIETKRDLRFVHNPQKVELLDRIHVGSKPVSFSDYENYYLHYQNDYVSIYDRALNQPYKIFAQVEVSGNALQNYKHHEKRMDSRSKVWNDFETPFFHPSLASSSKNSIDSWISSNMFDVSFKAWDIFNQRCLFPILKSYKKKVNLSMRNEVSYVKLEINGLDIYISKSWLHKKSFEVQPEKRFIDLLESTLGQRHPAEVAVFVSALNEQLESEKTKEGKPKYATWRPHAYLCKNTGQYAPWWNDHDFHWDRCKNKYGNNNDGKEYEDVQCECDNKCIENQNCCTDYFQSCAPEKQKHWADRECESELNTCPFEKPVTLIISTDGFRKEYLKRAEYIPNYLKIMECGSHTHMRCSYPSKTFPNHYTLVSGLHPGQHGIVDNDWFDWKRNASCSVFNDNSDREYPCAPMNQDEGWYGGDPIWNTAERHDKISAACLWPGCELEINNQRATYFWDYDEHGEGPFAERIYQLLEWLHLPAWNGQGKKEGHRPDFFTLYFDEPDHMGHAFGPYDETGELNRALKRVDIVLGMLMDGLRMYGFEHCVNIVLTADHGMETGLCEDQIEILSSAEHLLDQLYINAKSTVTVIGATKDDGGNKGKTWGSDFEIREAIDAYQCRHEELATRAFDKYALPKRLHYSDSTRIESVHLLMDGARKPQNPKYMPCDHTGYMATHGWDDKNEAMQINLIFYGPKFKANITEEQIGRVQNVEVYKLLLDLLEIPSDSDKLNTTTTSLTFSEWGKFAPVLKAPFHQPKSEETNFNWPMVPEDEKSSFDITEKSIVDKRHKNMVWSERKGLEHFLDNGLKAPFWWNSMLEMIDTVANTLELSADDSSVFQFGTLFDVTGGGYYMNPTEWTSGRTGFTGAGCETVEHWCKDSSDVFIPSHFYIIIRHAEKEVFSAMLPWRSEDVNDNCRIANQDECRAVYHGDFSCQSGNDLSLDWWAEQMDLHSVKVTEIEKLSNLKFFQHESIPAGTSVLLRTYLTDNGEFEKLFLPKEDVEVSNALSISCIYVSIFSFLYILI